MTLRNINIELPKPPPTHNPYVGTTLGRCGEPGVGQMEGFEIDRGYSEQDSVDSTATLDVVDPESSSVLLTWPLMDDDQEKSRIRIEVDDSAHTTITTGHHAAVDEETSSWQIDQEEPEQGANSTTPVLPSSSSLPQGTSVELNLLTEDDIQPADQRPLSQELLLSSTPCTDPPCPIRPEESPLTPAFALPANKICRLITCHQDRIPLTPEETTLLLVCLHDIYTSHNRTRQQNDQQQQQQPIEQHTVTQYPSIEQFMQSNSRPSQSSDWEDQSLPPSPTPSFTYSLSSSSSNSSISTVSSASFSTLCTLFFEQPEADLEINQDTPMINDASLEHTTSQTDLTITVSETPELKCIDSDITIDTSANNTSQVDRLPTNTLSSTTNTTAHLPITLPANTLTPILTVFHDFIITIPTAILFLPQIVPTSIFTSMFFFIFMILFFIQNIILVLMIMFFLYEIMIPSEY